MSQLPKCFPCYAWLPIHELIFDLESACTDGCQECQENNRRCTPAELIHRKVTDQHGIDIAHIIHEAIKTLIILKADKKTYPEAAICLKSIGEAQQKLQGLQAPAATRNDDRGVYEICAKLAATVMSITPRARAGKGNERHFDPALPKAASDVISRHLATVPTKSAETITTTLPPATEDGGPLLSQSQLQTIGLLAAVDLAEANRLLFEMLRTIGRGA
ncbi:hypothetical protein PG984_013850 [Apiospora sp. TS-2023a]